MKSKPSRSGIKYPKWYKISSRTERLATKFYFRPDISTPLPQKRCATKHGPGYIMSCTLAVAFSLFKKEHNEKIGFTKFTLLRPKNVRLLTNKHWNFCVCTVCQNITYKLKALNTVKNIKDFQQLLDIVLCPKTHAQRYHYSNCIFQHCEKCGKDTKKRLFNYFAEIKDDKEVSWNHWERVVEDGKTRKALKTKKGNYKVMLEEFVSDVLSPVQGTTFPEHLFIGQWQQRQFNEMKTNLPEDCVMLVMDFGKNRLIRFQDEPKSIYYTIHQVTIHPVVVFYRSLDITDLTVRESLVFLSDDHLHDHNAVNHFLEKTLMYLKEKEIPFKKVVVFSDGCASQYKGKGTFAQISLKDVPIEWNYFGSDHGKSECDGEVGSINRAVDIALLGRKVIISNAEEMFEWCASSNLCFDEIGSKRRFFLVNKGDIRRSNNLGDVQTLQGTRKIHHVSNVEGSPYKLCVKKLTCYCSFCRNNEAGGCVNTEYTGVYEEKLLRAYKSDTCKPRTRSKNINASSTPKPTKTPIKVATNNPSATGNTLEYWEKLKKCETYTDIQEATHDLVLPSLPPSLPEVTFVTHKREVDSAALKLLRFL